MILDRSAKKKKGRFSTHNWGQTGRHNNSRVNFDNVTKDGDSLTVVKFPDHHEVRTCVILDGANHSEKKHTHTHTHILLKNYDLTVSKHLQCARAKSSTQRRPLISTLYLQFITYWYNPRKPRASFEYKKAPHNRHSWHGDARPDVVRLLLLRIWSSDRKLWSVGCGWRSVPPLPEK